MTRRESWVALIVVAVGLIPAAILGLWGYMSLTAVPVHPNAEGVKSVTRAAPAAEWADAVQRGREIVRTGLSEENLPGLSVAVGVNGEIVWAEGFGWADVETQAPVAPETRLRIGTASTVLTSAAAGVLLQNGRLKLDEEIQAYVPGFPKKQWPVTLRQLMAHVAGVRTDGGDEGPLFSQTCDTPAEAVRFFGDRPLLFEPDTNYRYSSYGWILVSAAIETAAGEPLPGFMRKQVFEPLGLTDTRADSPEPLSNRAIPYFPRFASDPRYGLDLMREIHLSCYSGASVFLSTPSDLVRFGMGINGGKLLTPATVQLLQSSERLRTGKETGYGLGWDLETVSLAGQPSRSVGHDGDVLGGPVASLMTFPERGLAVAVISNTSYAKTFQLASRVADAFARHSASPGR